MPRPRPWTQPPRASIFCTGPNFQLSRSQRNLSVKPLPICKIYRIFAIQRAGKGSKADDGVKECRSVKMFKSRKHPTPNIELRTANIPDSPPLGIRCSVLDVRCFIALGRPTAWRINFFKNSVVYSVLAWCKCNQVKQGETETRGNPPQTARVSEMFFVAEKANFQPSRSDFSP